MEIYRNVLLIMKYEITVTVDTNDADYATKVTSITQEDIDKLIPLFKAIKNFKPYTVKINDINWDHSHNYPYGDSLREDLGEKSPAELYDFDAEIFEIFEEEYIPCCDEYGFHTIISVWIAPEQEKTVFI